MLAGELLGELVERDRRFLVILILEITLPGEERHLGGVLVGFEPFEELLPDLGGDDIFLRFEEMIGPDGNHLAIYRLDGESAK